MYNTGTIGLGWEMFNVACNNFMSDSLIGKLLQRI